MARLVLVLAVVALVGCKKPPEPVVCSTEPLVVRVSAQTRTTQFRWGFLLGITWTAGGTDPRALLDELSPQVWRASPAPNNNVLPYLEQAGFRQRHGTLLKFVLHDGFNIWLDDGSFPGQRLCVGLSCGSQRQSNFASFNELKTKWSTYLDELSASSFDADWFDVFGEPDDKITGISQAQLHELYFIAFDKLHARTTPVRMSAPGFNGYDREELFAFFDAAKAANKLPEALDWHSFGDPDDLAGQVAEQRAHCGSTCPEFHLGEYQPPETTAIPGEQVRWLSAGVEAGVTLANRACWDIKDTAEAMHTTCWNTFDAMLTPDLLGRQPGYWPHLWERQLGFERRAWSSPEKGVGVLAANTDAGTLDVVVGRAADGCTRALRLELEGVAAGRVSVGLDHVSDLGNKLSLTDVQPVHEDRTTNADGGVLLIDVPRVQSGDAWRVRVGR